MIDDVLANRTPWHIETGDVLDVFRAIPDESIHCVVTSPPYWGLRDYGVDGQIGLEDSVEAWVARMVEVFREVRRVLRSDGTCWLNLGDSYASMPPGKCKGDPMEKSGLSSKGRGGKAAAGTVRDLASGRKKPVPAGLKIKDLIGQPWRVAFALQADGWWLRQDIVWHKPNPMPEPVTDRCTKAHEYVFLLTKSARYFYDAEAVREGRQGKTNSRGTKRTPPVEQSGNGHEDWCAYMTRDDEITSRNARSVWTINPQPFPEAHFATFPEALPERCILAGTSAKGCCPTCGAPWVRVVEFSKYQPEIVPPGTRLVDESRGDKVRKLSGADYNRQVKRQTTGWRPSCDCEPADPVPCVVLDPFNGAGTTGVVAFRLGRRYLGAELNPEYADMARRRINATDPFAPRPVGDNGAQQRSLFG